MINKTHDRKLKYFMYVRKSSDAEDRQVQSIPDQIKVLKELATENGLEIVEILQESMSAKAPGRPVFTNMISRLNKGEADGIIVWKINRLARNPVDGGTISWMLQQSVVKHIQTYGRSYYPDDNVLIMSVELGMANQYVRDLSTDTKRGIRERADKGYPNGVATIGFINDLSKERGNRGWLVDKDRFPLIKQLLELYLTGRYSFRKLLRIANEEMGLRTPLRKRQGGKKLVLSYIAGTILKNPVYAGFFFTKDGERHKLHESIPRMITDENYWHIQKIMGNKGRQRPSVNLEMFPYKDPTTRCGGCGGGVTAEHKYQVICDCKLKFSYRDKEKCPKCSVLITDIETPLYLHYIYYHCTRKKNPNCKEKCVEEVAIDKYLADYYGSKLKISKALSDWCIENITALEKDDKQNEFERKTSLRKTLDQKQHEQKELALMRVRGQLTDDEFMGIKETLRGEIEAWKRELGKLEHVDQSGLQKAYKAFNLAIGIEEIFKNGGPEEKKEAFAEIGSNLTIKDKKPNVHNTNLYGVIMNGLLTAKTKYPRFEPENIIDTSILNEDFVPVRSTLLRG
ncbi:MAG: recombinase family protein [bacterium]|nr:recombinase family protein [bacterium]